jgi:hypothetical protein
MKKDEHREVVLTHLEYIRKMIDDNSRQLEKINGRVRKNEKSIGWIVGVGTTFAFAISSILGFLNIKD